MAQSYQSTTLRQFLGPHKPIEAAALAHDWGWPYDTTNWSRKAMYKGKLAIIRALMASFQAVISHDKNGQPAHAAYLSIGVVRAFFD